jgi:hypothetical protein
MVILPMCTIACLELKNPSLPTIVHYDVGPNELISGAHCTI